VRAGDELIGYVAAGGYGHVVEKTIALAYLPTAYLEPGTRVEIEMLGERISAEVVAQPLYDPENARLLS
jgi:glycine cleavage system aminomethyltransferase T